MKQNKKSDKIHITNDLICFFTKIFIPYIFIFLVYIQLNGTSSPGGGFQAGSIFGSIIVAYSLIFDSNFLHDKTKLLVIIGISGILIYYFTGMIGIFKGYSFLNLACLFDSPKSHKLCLEMIEAGIGLSVGCSMVLIYIFFSSIEE